MSEKIICNSCKSEYKNVFNIEGQQATDCSSELIIKNNKKLSISHYGSTYDMLKHVFKKESEYSSGNICDNCICKAIREGDAVEDQSFFYFK
ncbi:hypothetical protein GW796_06290 [archaeon]|nr:hypothetical protein [archaeon]